MIYFVRLYFAIAFSLLLIDFLAAIAGWKNFPIGNPQVVHFRGTKGNVVSIPWIGNGYNTRMCLNIPSGDRRDWIWVWCWQVEKEMR